MEAGGYGGHQGTDGRNDSGGRSLVSRLTSGPIFSWLNRQSPGIFYHLKPRVTSAPLCPPSVRIPVCDTFSGTSVLLATVCFLNDQSYKIAHIQSLHILHPDSNLCKETLKSKVKRIDVYGVVSLLHPSFCTFPTSLCLFFPSGNY